MAEQVKGRKPKPPMSSYLVQLRHIRALVNNTLIHNVNYSNSYFGNQSKHELLHDTLQRAGYILELLDSYIQGEVEELAAEQEKELQSKIEIQKQGQRN